MCHRLLRLRTFFCCFLDNILDHLAHTFLQKLEIFLRHALAEQLVEIVHNMLCGFIGNFNLVRAPFLKLRKLLREIRFLHQVFFILTHLLHDLVQNLKHLL